jgi:signal recognition particle subunit SRP54
LVGFAGAGAVRVVVAGVRARVVNRLLKELERMQDMMKKMKGVGMMKRLGGMKGMGGGMPKMPF